MVYPTHTLNICYTAALDQYLLAATHRFQTDPHYTNMINVYTAVLVHDMSNSILPKYDTLNVRVYVCCKIVRCR